MAKRLYIDTSAYLCILLGEAGSEELRQEANSGNLLSSVLLIVETHRNLVRYSREGLIPVSRFQDLMNQFEEDREMFQFLDLDRASACRLVFPTVSIPRALDLIHLQAALAFHAAEPLTRFVSLDTHQIQAAVELGIPV